jgi:desulfoferrodoxin (superoxide reductase-like protein)
MKPSNLLRPFRRAHDLRDSSPGEVSRRGFLGLLGATTATACTIGSSSEVEINLSWQNRAIELKGDNVYSRSAPGIWAGKEGTHVPTITAMGGGVYEVSLTHGVAEGHWITAIFVEDDLGNVIHLRELMARGPSVTKAVTSLTVAPGTRSITAFAFCNLHDCWQSDPFTIG